MKFMYKYWTLHQPTPHEKDHIQKPVATKLRPKPVLRQQLDHIYSNHLPRFSYRPYFHHRYRAVNAKPLSTLIPLKQKHFLHPTLNTNNNNGLKQANSTEECRGRKRKYHPYEESFAYIIEYKADFPHTLSLSHSVYLQHAHFSSHAQAVPCVVSCVPCTGAYIIFRIYTHTYFSGYYQIFPFRFEAPCHLAAYVLSLHVAFTADGYWKHEKCFVQTSEMLLFYISLSDISRQTGLT